MAPIITEHSPENKAYIRRLLEYKQPGFLAALELAADVRPPEMPRVISAPEGS
jgi:hypothetical protein